MGVAEEFDLLDPRDNIHTGMLYFKYLSDRFGDVTRAIQAYNLGPGAVDRGKRNKKYLGKVMRRAFGG